MELIRIFDDLGVPQERLAAMKSLSEACLQLASTYSGGNSR
jgi:hypothetical protein